MSDPSTSSGWDASTPGAAGPEADFPASLLNPGQVESAISWQALQNSPKKPAWWADYLAIKREFPYFHNWRIWVYIAAMGQPEPPTIEELAKTVLGCTSRAVRNWHARDWGDNPTIDDAIVWAKKSPLLRKRRAIYDALVTVAATADPKAHQDRKLALEMLGDYRPTGGKPEEKEREQMDKWLQELKEAA